ncbi:MAG TPA: ATP synthase F1 subunit epsilon [Ignavibacteria bacterium]
MGKYLHLEIITTDRKIFNGDVISVTAPGTLGEFQVLYNHAPLVSTLDIGRIKIVGTSKNEEVYASSGGILEVRDNKIIILAEAIEKENEIDINRAEKALQKAKDIINTKSNINKFEETLALKRAKNRLKIAKK